MMEWQTARISTGAPEAFSGRGVPGEIRAYIRVEKANIVQKSDVFG